MSELSASRLKALWILPPVILAVIVFIAMKSGQQQPGLSPVVESVRTVRTITVTKRDFTPIARGYGIVKPAQVWKSIAQVSGRIVEKHPRLNNGEIIQKGEVLLKIDPVDYELSLAQAETQLAELEVQQSNASSSLEIELRNQQLARDEYQRLQKLLVKGSVSQSAADTAERTLLNSQAAVQNLRNNLALLPSQKKLQQARIRQAQRDLENTRVTAPFNLRISNLDVEQDQFVSKGQHLFSGDSIDRVEITAQVAMSSLKNLFSPQRGINTDISEISSHLSNLTGFTPSVELDIGNMEKARWDAEFVRFSDSVDSDTRTIGVIIAIDHPLKKIIPGTRPPLSKGMFVEVNIAGRTLTDQVVIPRSAIRNNQVYVLDKDSRLQIRPVSLGFSQQGHSIVSSGLNPGEYVILTDIIPAVVGMRLKAVTDTTTGE
jgi:RND family efflux transporter MFP subunit